MNKLSKKSIEKFKIFLDDKEFSYISLTRHEFKILFNIYNSVIPLISEAEEKENRLIKHLEDKKEQSHKQEIICRKRQVPKLYEIGICLGEQYAYENILEKVKSGKYE